MVDDTTPAPASSQSADEKPKVEQSSEAQVADHAESGHEAPRKDQGVFVVGIGASAGGLEALEDLVKSIAHINAALVVVQHLSPHYASALPQLLARNSKIEIVTAADGAVLEGNRIYVIPPNADLSVLRGVLHITALEGGQSPHFAIDHFFRSLADDQGPYAIGVILSGTGTDGTFGLTAIKAAGGLTFVQEPTSAKYDGMPRSALGSGTADFCLTPNEIGEELVHITSNRYLKRSPRPVTAAYGEEELAKLFILIRSEFGNDLTHYKSATLDRRIERRMTLHKLGKLSEYVKFVQSNHEELRALYKDMLITVTSFFRDPDAFEALKTVVFPNLLQNRNAREPIRVWAPGCASGEEAYSLAICLLEFLEDRVQNINVQIFGTDIDEDSIQHARRGVYAQNISLDVSAERLNRFFILKNGEYQISRRVRDMVIFSKHNILKDAPFSRINLASCRNLLIYLRPSAQQRVLRALHYALSQPGFLLLGSSESVGDSPDLFSLVDRKNKVYSKKPVSSPAGPDVNFNVPEPFQAPERQLPRKTGLSLKELADRRVLEFYGPPGVIINEQLEILEFRGHTGPYLDPSPGAASFNILTLARRDLHIELKKVIEQALSQQIRMSAETTYQEEAKQNAIKLDVMPILDPNTKARCLLVLFHKLPFPKEVHVFLQGADGGNEGLLPLAQRVQELEGELAVTKEYLQTTIQERQSANEELKVANEELQSSNEELQSTNEELETSREEMQSTNEELTTLNEELHNRMTELSQINDDLHNVLGGVDIAVVMVGMDLRIRRYTAAAERLLNLAPSDVGRPVDVADSFLGPSKIGSKVSSVIQTLSTHDEDILGSNRRWYAMRISPYKTLDHSIRGAIITLTDVDIQKRAKEMSRDVASYAAEFLAAIDHPLFIVDKKLRIVWANERFLDTFQTAQEETVGALLASLNMGQWVDQGLMELLNRALSAGKKFVDYKMRFRFPEEGERTLKVGASQIPASGENQLILVSIEHTGAPEGSQ